MEIRWPHRYHPNRAPVHVRNERVIDAPADVVWQWLVHAERWPDWYPNSRAVRMVREPGATLVLGSRFRWRTFGVPLCSEVVEFDAPSRIAWTARGFGVDAYHAWGLDACSATSCRVLTEETQYGFVARLGAVLFPRRMWNGHELWLARLGERAKAGRPTGPQGHEASGSTRH